MRAVRATMKDRAEIDPTSLNLFLRNRFTPSPYTILKGIHKLAPGTKLTVQDGNWEVSRWYQFKPVPFSPPKSLDEAKEELLELYKRAIRRQLISDVPVGLLLSGGLDSALLLGLMNLNGDSWPTYTVGYGSSFADDELADAAETARILGAKHSSITITKSIFEEALPKIVTSLEEPIASSSIVPMYFVCERARQDVKVALVGQGPDELFGGYNRHLGIRYGALWGALPNRLDARADHAALSQRYRETKCSSAVSGPWVLQTGCAGTRMFYHYFRAPRLTSSISGRITREPDSGDAVLKCWEDLVPLMTETDELGGLQFLEVRSTLPDELLMYADKLSMAHSLELRVPFLDKEIVEYVERLPASMKVRNGSRKWLHRQVCRTYLPDSILRRPKRGFAVNVVDDWFRSSADSKIAALRDPSSNIYQYLRPAAVRELCDQHTRGQRDNHKILFSLVLFEEWLRVHDEPVAAFN